METLEFNKLMNRVMGLAVLTESDTTYTAKVTFSDECLISYCKQITLPGRGWDVKKFQTRDRGLVGVNALTDKEKDSIAKESLKMDLDAAQFNEYGMPYYYDYRKGGGDRVSKPRAERDPLAKWLQLILASGTEEQKQQLKALVEPWVKEVEENKKKVELQAKIATLNPTEVNELPKWVNADNFSMIPEYVKFKVSPIGMNADTVALVKAHQDRIVIAW